MHGSFESHIFLFIVAKTSGLKLTLHVSFESHIFLFIVAKTSGLKLTLHVSFESHIFLFIVTKTSFKMMNATILSSNLSVKILGHPGHQMVASFKNDECYEIFFKFISQNFGAPRTSNCSLFQK